MRIALLIVLVCCSALMTSAQELQLTKGRVLENLALQDSVGSRMLLYLPTNFDVARQWPVLFLTTQEGSPSQSMRFMAGAAEREGYILAANTALLDTLPLTQKVLYVAGSLDKLKEILPVDSRQIYVGGLRANAELAQILPSLVKGIRGVLALSSAPPNPELLSLRASFHYVGVVHRGDHHYLPTVASEISLREKRIPYYLRYFESDLELPGEELIAEALAVLRVMAMKGGHIARDSAYIRKTYERVLTQISLEQKKEAFIVSEALADMGGELFDDLLPTTGLNAARTSVRRSDGFRSQRRALRNLKLKEQILSDDFVYYLEEDILRFNLDNLGWWRYQIQAIEGFKKSEEHEERLMGKRLHSYIDALIEDYETLAFAAKPVDEDALILLGMLRTLSHPTAPEGYLRVISLTSKYNDYGTALFYLEELLKTGYRDKQKLYDLEHTALLRIGLEFNALIEKYLNDPRYEVPENPDEGGLWPGY